MQPRPQPLAGTRIVVTRARAQASELVRLIEAHGGTAVEFPVIGVTWPEDLGPLDAALHMLESFDWIAFTSVNGVEMFYQRLAHHNKEMTLPAGLRVAAVGPKTAQALQERGVQVALLAKEFVGEGLADALAEQVTPGTRILLPRANLARKQLPERLQELGCAVVDVVAYQNVLTADHADELVAMLQAGAIDVITFTSGSTVTNFYQALAGHDVTALLQGVLVVAIGPVTAAEAERHGLHVDVMPAQYTIADMVEALLATVQKEVHRDELV